MDRSRVPVTVVAGHLGAGKTTTVLEAFRHRPAGERWAVLVNEFGRVGIDGAILSADGVEVREIAGGCVCCVGATMLRAGLVRLLREVRPDRLLIEPSGLAHPASVLDHLRSPGLRESVDLRATLLLVHARRFRPDDPAQADAVAAADVLVGTHADTLSEVELARFHARAATLWPAPIRIVTSSFGVVDPGLLELTPGPVAPLRLPHPPEGRAEHGWIWPAEVLFDEDAVVSLCQRLARPGHPALPQGADRIKGLFRTTRGWRLVQVTPDTVRSTPTAWRRDSRCEAIAAGSADWDLLDAAWAEAREERRRQDGGTGPFEV